MYKIFIVLIINHYRRHLACLKEAITHITEVVSVLLGQDNSWEVDDAGEFHSAWKLAVEPFIENILCVSSFDDINRVLRRPAAPFHPLHISFVYSLRHKV